MDSAAANMDSVARRQIIAGLAASLSAQEIAALDLTVAPFAAASTVTADQAPITVVLGVTQSEVTVPSQDRPLHHQHPVPLPQHPFLPLPLPSLPLPRRQQVVQEFWLCTGDRMAMRVPWRPRVSRGGITL